MAQTSGLYTQFFPYEFDSGVARLNQGDWGVEIYIVNRGATEALARAYVIQAVGGNSDGVSEYTERFNSGDQIVAPGQWAFSQFQPNNDAELGLYWCRIVATSKDVVPSASFYRPSDDAPGAGTVADFSYAPGDFAVFSPSSVPLLPIIAPPARSVEGSIPLSSASKASPKT
jgi:hypothetical protein